MSVAEIDKDVQGDTLAIGAHVVGLEMTKEIKRRDIKIIDTTCQIVHRAQSVAQRPSKTGFFIVIYGDGNHPEVKGILAWADDKGIATLSAGKIAELRPLPRQIGILAQTTQIRANFNEFVKNIIDIALKKDSEEYIVDTICHQ